MVVYDQYGAAGMLCTNEWKYVQRHPVPGHPTGPNELYDLVNDPDERDNRVEDPEQRRRGRELRGMLESWFAEQATAEHDDRYLPVAGGGQLRRSRGGACPGTDRFFSREAPRLVRRYRRDGLEAVQRKLLEGLTAVGVVGDSVLEIGYGTGELQRRVLATGAAGTVGIDVAGGMIAQAQAATTQAGLEQRTTYLVGDAVERAAELPPAALVLLYKVMCCYPEIDTLLEVSLERTQCLSQWWWYRDPTGWWQPCGDSPSRCSSCCAAPPTPPITTAATLRRPSPAPASAASFTAQTLAWEAWIFPRAV